MSSALVTNTDQRNRNLINPQKLQITSSEQLLTRESKIIIEKSPLNKQQEDISSSSNFCQGSEMRDRNDLVNAQKEGSTSNNQQSESNQNMKKSWKNNEEIQIQGNFSDTYNSQIFQTNENENQMNTLLIDPIQETLGPLNTSKKPGNSIITSQMRSKLKNRHNFIKASEQSNDSMIQSTNQKQRSTSKIVPETSNKGNQKVSLEGTEFKELTLRVPGTQGAPSIKSSPFIALGISPRKQQRFPSQLHLTSTKSDKLPPSPALSPPAPPNSSGLTGIFKYLKNKITGHRNSNISNENSNNVQINGAQNPQLINFQEGNQNITNTLIINNAGNFTTEINPGTNWNFVKKLAKVKKFINSIKTTSVYQSFYKVKQIHLSLVSDKADFTKPMNFQQSQQTTKAQVSEFRVRIFSNFLSNIESWFISMPLFLPHQPLLNYFKIAMLLFTIISLVFIPLVGSFSLSQAIWESNLSPILYVPYILFPIEILISLNTAYYEEGDIQMNRLKILKQYSKTNLIIDFTSTAACFFLKVEQQIIFVILFMIRILKIPAYRRDINEFFYIQQRVNTLYTLINLILSVMILAHYFACGFNYIASIEEEKNTPSWVITLSIDPYDWLSRYINSIYFSFITMVTVGFGDIKPTTDTEKVYVTLVALISSLVFAYTVNTIGTVFQEIAQQEAEYKAQKYHLSVYMRSRSINQQLQTRVMKYLDHMIHKQLESPQKGQEILKGMSKKIKDDVYKDFFGKILLEQKMFKFNFSESFLKELTIQMKEIICRPGETIFSFNEVDNRIFFINKGEVELFLEKDNKNNEQDTYSYDILGKGDIFGEQSFFTSKLRETAAKSLSISHLIFCTQEDFISMLSQFPKDYEKFCQMKDEVMIYGEQINTRCRACEKFRHSIASCPYAHLIRRRENVIHKHIRSSPNERGYHERKKEIKNNTFNINFQIRIKLRQIRRQYIEDSTKGNKKDDNQQVDEVKGTYNININRLNDSEDDDCLTQKVELETKAELRKMSDKKFFLSLPKLHLDSLLQICIDREEEEVIEELEQDEESYEELEGEEEDEDEDQDYEDDDNSNSQSDENSSLSSGQLSYEREGDEKEDQQEQSYHLEVENKAKDVQNMKKTDYDSQNYNIYHTEKGSISSPSSSVHKESIFKAESDLKKRGSLTESKPHFFPPNQSESHYQKMNSIKDIIFESANEISSSINFKFENSTQNFIPGKGSLEDLDPKQVPEIKLNSNDKESIQLDQISDTDKAIQFSCTSLGEKTLNKRENDKMNLKENSKFMFKGSVFQLQIADLATQQKKAQKQREVENQQQEKQQDVKAPVFKKMIKKAYLMNKAFSRAETIATVGHKSKLVDIDELTGDSKKFKPRKRSLNQNDFKLGVEGSSSQEPPEFLKSLELKFPPKKQKSIVRQHSLFKPKESAPINQLKRKDTVFASADDLSNQKPQQVAGSKFRKQDSLSVENFLEFGQHQKKRKKSQGSSQKQTLEPLSSYQNLLVPPINSSRRKSVMSQINLEIQDEKKIPLKKMDTNKSSGSEYLQLPSSNRSIPSNITQSKSTIPNAEKSQQFPFLKKQTLYKNNDFNSSNLHSQISLQVPQLNPIISSLNNAQNPFNRQVSINQYQQQQQQQNGYSLNPNTLMSPPRPFPPSSHQLQANVQQTQLSAQKLQQSPPLILQPQIQQTQQLTSQNSLQQTQINQPTQLISQMSLNLPQFLPNNMGNSFQPSFIQHSNQFVGSATTELAFAQEVAFHQQSQEYRAQKSLFLYDFDKMKEFTNYFPHNNYSIVCKEKKKQFINRKNYFQSKRMLLGTSTRNLFLLSAKQQLNQNLVAPSPRHNAMHHSLLLQNNSQNSSFKEQHPSSNKLFSALIQANPNVIQLFGKKHNSSNNGTQVPHLMVQSSFNNKEKMKKSVDLLNFSRKSQRSNSKHSFQIDNSAATADQENKKGIKRQQISPILQNSAESTERHESFRPPEENRIENQKYLHIKRVNSESED